MTLVFSCWMIMLAPGKHHQNDKQDTHGKETHAQPGSQPGGQA